MSLFARLLDPAPLWDDLAQRLADRPQAVLARAGQIAAFGALGAAVAAELGARWMTTRLSGAFGFLPRPDGPQHPFAITLVGMLAMPVVLALCFLLVARWYRLAPGPLRALVVAVYGALPVYAAMLLVWLPAAILVVVAAVVISLIWWGAGCRRLLAVPPEEAAPFIGVALLLALVASQILGTVLAPLL